MKKSNKLENVKYDIRGPILREANRLISKGETITKLNIGNPGIFGFDVPKSIVDFVIENIDKVKPYSDSKGLASAREKILDYSLNKGFADINIDDIYIGNGASELITVAMQALLDDGDEILVPAPDYPLWTASVNYSGGRAVHYLCDEGSDWIPDLEDIERKITSRTKGIVIINPNNPTGAVYPLEIIERIVRIAEKHKLVIFSDEIYDRILYDGAKHFSPATLTREALVLTFNGISKSYRAAGYRGGWMIISKHGKNFADGYIDGIEILSSMRLCSNVFAQLAIEAALMDDSIGELVASGGRLFEQRNTVHSLLNSIEGVSAVKPKGSLYIFPKIDINRFRIVDDREFALELLKQEKVLIVQGSGFNWPTFDHFRVVFLAQNEILSKAVNSIGNFLNNYS